MSKIIIIENQKTQFDALQCGLVNNDVVGSEELYPFEDNDWRIFMNWVKIAINRDYADIDKGEYRRNAKKNLYDIITTQKPSILIVDYLLGGTTCEKGVELAQDIINYFLKNVGNPQFSIIFLSRERPTSEYDDLREKYKNKINIDWLSKSYSQDKNLEENYIKNKLCKEIKEVLEKHSQREDPEVVNVLNSFLEEEDEYYCIKGFRQKVNEFKNMRCAAKEVKYHRLDDTIISILSKCKERDWENRMQTVLKQMNALVQDYNESYHIRPK